MAATETLTGGCQCGAVRFRIDGEVRHTSVCHCRMCQKATGGIFGVFATVRVTELSWTRGAPSVFKSSSVAERGFCSSCGTPLTYAARGAKHVAITFGAFDKVDRLNVDFSLEASNTHPAVAGIMDVPEHPMTSTQQEADAYAELRNFQHPDHNTSDWPPTEEN